MGQSKAKAAHRGMYDAESRSKSSRHRRVGEGGEAGRQTVADKVIEARRDKPPGQIALALGNRARSNQKPILVHSGAKRPADWRFGPAAVRLSLLV